MHVNNARAEYLKAKSIHIKNDWSVCHIDGEKKNLKEDISITIEKTSVKVFTKRC